MSSNFFLMPILKSAVFPLLAGVISALFLNKFSKGEGRDWPAALSLIIGFSTGFFAISGFNGFPPVNVTDWLPYTGIFIFLAMLPFAKPAMASIAGFLAMAPIVWVHVQPRLQALSTGKFALLAAGVLVALALVLLVWNKADKEADKPEIFLFMVMSATAISLCCLYGSAKTAQLAGVLASASGGIFLISFFKPTLRSGPITRAVFIAIFGGLATQAWIYAEISMIAIALTLVTALLVLLLRLPGFAKMAVWKRWALVIVASSLPIIPAIIYLAKTAVSDDYYDY